MYQIEIGYCTQEIMINLLRKSVTLHCLRANLCTKTKTHYEVLEVTPNATHSEIKSAYYKQSLKYHPDVNSTQVALKMFQEISNAYEILGNYKSRKQYDRSIMVKQGIDENIKRTSDRRTNRFEEKSGPVPKKIYDFDEWTKMHYNTGFEYHQQRKIIYESYKDEIRKEKLHVANKSNDMWIFNLIALALMSVMIYSLLKPDDNDIAVKPQEKKKT